LVWSYVIFLGLVQFCLNWFGNLALIWFGFNFDLILQNLGGFCSGWFYLVFIWLSNRLVVLPICFWLYSVWFGRIWFYLVFVWFLFGSRLVFIGFRFNLVWIRFGSNLIFIWLCLIIIWFGIYLVLFNCLLVLSFRFDLIFLGFIWAYLVLCGLVWINSVLDLIWFHFGYNFV